MTVRGRGRAAGKVGPDVPVDLRLQFDQIAARGAAAGRPLRPVPLLEITCRASRGSLAILGGGVVPRVRLAADVLSTAAPDRAFTIAHELSHALRRQEGARPVVTTRFLVGAGLVGASAVAAVLGAAFSALLGSGRYVGLLYAVAMLGVSALWFVLVALIRWEETATDATTAVVFGEVLTEAGVERLRCDEGRAARYLPTVLRTHPHPRDRRGAGLVATAGVGLLGHADGTTRPRGCTHE